MVSLLNSKGFKGVNWGKDLGVGENVPGRTSGMRACKSVFLKGGASGSLRRDMYLHETLPCIGVYLAAPPTGPTGQ